MLMSDDHFDGGDLLGLFLLGALLSSQRRPPGHYHGDHWHSHDSPPGNHVHDVHADGPIRGVPPSPEQLAAEKARRKRRREGWAAALACVAILLGTTREPGLMLAFGAAALTLSEAARHRIGRSAGALQHACFEGETDASSQGVAVRRVVGRDAGNAPAIGVEIIDVTPPSPSPPHPHTPASDRAAPTGTGTADDPQLHGRSRRRRDLEVLARIRNNGTPVRQAWVTASALVGERIVAMADVGV
ncbi:MAG: hypothetical protein M3O70_10050 [Actinomycetota bacterium]|nr:hypothetical protein [Actinomycetota bacterium]